MKIGIRERIILGFLIGSVAFLVAGGIAFKISQDLTKASISYKLINFLKADLEDVSKIIDSAIRYSSVDSIANALPLFEEMNLKIGELKKIGHKTASIEDSVDKLKRSAENIYETRDLSPEKLSELSDNLIKVKTDLDDSLREHSILLGKYANIIKISIPLSVLLSILFIIIIGFVVSTQIQRVAGRVSASLKEIGEGVSDLTRELEVRTSDEIGKIALNFNIFLGKLRQIILGIKDTANSIGEFVGANSQMISRIHSLMSNLLSEISKMSTAAEEFSSTIAEATKNLSEISSFVEKASDRVVASSQTVGNSLNSIIKIIEEMKRVVEVIKNVEFIQRKIIGFVSAIMDITDQTNLLSLNASIEASRAGEHGKGFAVVAEEIRKLSQRTAQLAKEISSTLSSFGTEMNKVLDLINWVILDVGEKIKSAEHGVVALQEIQEKFLKVKDEIAAIATTFEEQERTAMEISRSVSAIVQMAEEPEKMIRDVKKKSEEVNEKVENLIRIVENFKV